MSDEDNGRVTPEQIENEATPLIARDGDLYTPSPLPSYGRSLSTPDILASTRNPRARPRSSTVSSMVSASMELVRSRLDKRKFGYLILSSIFIYLAFVAAFAPRTSLSRDFRRWHGSKLTTSEVYRIFLDTLQEENLTHKHMKHYSDMESSADSCQYTVEEFQKLGFEPKMHNYYPWVKIPEDTRVQLLQNGTSVWNASLTEDVAGSGSTSKDSSFKKAFHSYSPDGEVTGSFVFCNYGSLDDYKLLLDHNISIEGKVHIVRYGHLTAGIKVKNAELYGASSVLIYNDPYDDGLVTERNGYKPFPEGPARNPTSFERDSVEYIFASPGDPTSPDFPSKSQDIERLSPAGKLPRIPSIPMSINDIRPILLKLKGRGITLGKGNIDGFDYSSGPSDDSVKINILNKQKPAVINIKDVVIEIPGIFSSGDIIIGAQRDSWVDGMGASSPGSGSSVLLEVARGLSKLKKRGWKPLRTIKLVSWDAERYGMIGSTEYIEDFATNLKKNALVYIDLDTAVSGTKFQCNTNPLLENVIIKAAKSTSFKSDEEWTLYDEWMRSNDAAIDGLKGISNGALFQSHLGVSSVNCGFTNNKETDAVYHENSFFDSHEWMEQFIDPKYKLHNTLASFTGIMALMLGEQELNFLTLHPYVKDIHKRILSLNARISEIFPHDNELHHIANTVEALIGLATWQDSVVFDKKVREVYNACFVDMPIWAGFSKLKLYISLHRLNTKLKNFDKIFLTQHGLSERSWMKHSLLAPSKYDGLTCDILPGLHEAVVEMNRRDVLSELEILLTQFENVRALLK